MLVTTALLVALAAEPPDKAGPIAATRMTPPPGPLSPLAEGEAAPAFKLRALDGAVVRLDEIAYPGKDKTWAKKQPVLIDFFRTDCGPCRASMPELVQLHKEYGARGLKVLLIALLEPEQGREKLERYLAEQKLALPIAIDETEHFAKKYLGPSVTLPATFLIDQTGTIKRIKQGAKGSLKEHFVTSIAEVLAGRG